MKHMNEYLCTVHVKRRRNHEVTLYFINPIEFRSDDVTKMILLNYGIFSIVQNNLSERSSHAKHWLFSALNS